MSLSFTPVPPPTALGVHVVNELRGLVISGKLPTGARLVEAKLSEQFGTSRGPIRDALRILESENLIETRRNGAYVVGLTMRDLEELYGLRGLVELEALKLCAGVTDPDWSTVEDALARMRIAATSGDFDALGAADLDFHSAFYPVAGQRRLEKVWAQYCPTFRVLLSLSNAEGGARTANTVDDHQALLAAVKSGQIAEIETRFHAHNSESLRRMASVVERHQDRSRVRDISDGPSK